MKSLVSILIVFAFVLGCNSQKATSDKPVAVQDTVKIENDSLGYEVIIVDAGFNSWLAGRAYPRNFYSQSYLEAKNRIWVYEWNIRATNPAYYRDIYDMQIDYSPTVNYGYEVNYLLYNYLVYFQNKFGQKLGGRVPDR